MVANVLTGEVQRVTDKKVDGRNPAWSPDGQWTSYQASRFSSPTHTGIFLERSVRFNEAIYGEGKFPYCWRAQRLLRRKRYAFDAVDVTLFRHTGKATMT